MSGAVERSLKIVEYLSEHPDGVALSALAADLEVPLSAAHRLLVELVRLGYVRQESHDGHYRLTTRLLAIGLAYLSRSGIVDVAQPLLEQLAAVSGELVRLAVVDGEDLIFVAKAQGARRGLRYDPDMGLSVALACSAAGHAWLATLPEEQALAVVARKGLCDPAAFGPRAPTSIGAVMEYVAAARDRGYSVINEVFAPGMTAMAAPVFGADGEAVGVITIAGPLVRLTEARMAELGPAILDIAAQVSRASGASQLLRKRA